MWPLNNFIKSICIFFLLVLLCGFSAPNLPGYLHGALRREIAKQLTISLRREVSIGSVKGTLLNQAELYNIKIAKDKELKAGTLATINKITVKYNPLKFILSRADLLPAISWLEVDGLEALVIREKNGSLNVEKLLPPADPKSGSTAPAFRATIDIKNSKLLYTDLVGFAPDQKNLPFKTKINRVSARLDFRQKNSLILSANGLVTQKQTVAPVSVLGSINLSNANSNFSIYAENLAVKEWGGYVAPLPGVTVESGTARVDLALSSTPGNSTPPFSVKAKIRLTQTNLTAFAHRFSEINGNFVLNNVGLDITGINLAYKKLPFLIRGKLTNFSQPRINLFLSSPKNINLASVSESFPELNALKLAGEGNFSLQLSGPISHPQISGIASSPHGFLLDQPFSGKILVSGDTQKLSFNVDPLNYFQGSTTGQINLFLNTPDPTIDAGIIFRDIQAANFAPDFPGIEGTINGKLNLSGSSKNLKGEMTAILAEANLFGQAVDTLQFSFTLTPEGLAVKNFVLTDGKATVSAQGSFFKDGLINLAFDTKELYLKGDGPLGEMEALLDKFSGSAAWRMDSTFFRAPIQNLDFTGNFSLRNGKIGEQTINAINGDLQLKENIFEIKKLVAVAGKSTVDIKGSLGSTDTALVFSTKNAHLSDFQILGQLLPEKHEHPTGRFSLSVALSGPLPQDLASNPLGQLGNLNWQINGEVENTRFFHTLFQNFKFSLLWNKHQLENLTANLKTKNSTARVEYLNATDQKVSASGKIDLDELYFLLYRLGNFGGQLNFNLLSNPASPGPVEIKLSGRNFAYNSIVLDSFSGQFTLDDLKLKTVNPATVNINSDNYLLDGDLSLKVNPLGQLQLDQTNLKVKFNRADLNTTYYTVKNIINETLRFVPSASQFSGSSKLSLKNLQTPNPKNFSRGDDLLFYLLDEKGNIKNGFLKAFAAFAEKPQSTQPQAAIDWNLDLAGQIGGEVLISGPVENLKIATQNFTVDQGRIFEFTFNHLDLQGTYLNRAIHLDKCKFSKDGGVSSILGNLDFKTSTLALKLFANRFPTDSLKLLFPGGKTFEGKLNLEAMLSGPFNNPVVSAQAFSNNIVIQGVALQDVTLDLGIKDHQINLNNLQLSSQNKDSKITGNFSLDPNGPINLTASLEGEALGLVNLLTNDIQWKEGTGHAAVSITGLRPQLEINGEIGIKNARVFVAPLYSTLKNLNGSLIINHSLGELANLSAAWEGTHTKDVRNEVSLSGTIVIKELLASPARVELDLKLADTYLSLDLPNQIDGNLSLKNLILKGPWFFNAPRADQPPTKLFGEIKLEDCILYLAQGTNKKPPPNIDYDLSLTFGRNAYVVGGDTSNVVNPVFINVELTGENITLKGVAREPSLHGELQFLQGTITLFDREFLLLSNENQEKYFSSQRDKINQNKAVFKGGSGSEASVPELMLTAKVVVDNYVENSDGTQSKEKVTIISQISGMPFVKDEFKSIKTGFYSFREESGMSNIEVANFTQDEIKLLLLPDFLKGALGLSSSSTNIDTTALAADYISNRFQSYLSTTLGRKIEKSLGLENLTLEYNLGRDLKRMGGAIASDDTEEKLWGVAFAKNLVDRFYIDLRYSEALDNTTQAKKQYFNYELSYKLSQIWSLAYYQEPNNISDPFSGQNKFTLQGKLRY